MIALIHSLCPSGKGWTPSLLCLCLALVGCERNQQTQESPGSGQPTDAGTKPAWLKQDDTPAAPKGMAWIPPGALVAGTPKESLPRKADQEMPGEQVILDGFFIDKFAYPNGQGAIPLSNVTLKEAAELCGDRGKRLCSEFEWERACKGPRNLKYEYGNRYQEGICGTGGPAKRLPSGYRFGCRSEFGVHDLHGSLWEWTDSPWGRGTKGDDVTLRGGNASDGRVVGRCANGRNVSRTAKDPAIGFRCCKGPRNSAEVTLGINKGQALRRVVKLDRKLLKALETQLPEEVQAQMKERGVFRMARLWEWKPVANEDLLLAGGCAGVPPLRKCGILIVRRTLGRLDVLDWADAGHFVPMVKLKYNPLKVWVYGGDKRSHFRRQVLFDWGDVRVGEIRRTVGDGRRTGRVAKEGKRQPDQRKLEARRKFGRSGAKGPRPPRKSPPRKKRQRKKRRSKKKQ